MKLEKINNFMDLKKMNENEFIESIDSFFPYYDEKKWRKIIKKATEISDNASFMVLHEICRAPKDIEPTHQLYMLFEWGKIFEHPIKN